MGPLREAVGGPGIRDLLVGKNPSSQEKRKKYWDTVVAALHIHKHHKCPLPDCFVCFFFNSAEQNSVRMWGTCVNGGAANKSQYLPDTYRCCLKDWLSQDEHLNRWSRGYSDMTSSHLVHLTCLLRFPVYYYLYPPTHENSNDFIRLQHQTVYRCHKGTNKTNSQIR